MIKWQVERVITIYFFTLNHNRINNFYIYAVEYEYNDSLKIKQTNTNVKERITFKGSDYNVLNLERTRTTEHVQKIIDITFENHHLRWLFFGCWLRAEGMGCDWFLSP